MSAGPPAAAHSERGGSGVRPTSARRTRRPARQRLRDLGADAAQAAGDQVDAVLADAARSPARRRGGPAPSRGPSGGRPRRATMPLPARGDLPRQRTRSAAVDRRQLDVDDAAGDVRQLPGDHPRRRPAGSPARGPQLLAAGDVEEAGADDAEIDPAGGLRQARRARGRGDEAVEGRAPGPPRTQAAGRHAPEVRRPGPGGSRSPPQRTARRSSLRPRSASARSRPWLPQRARQRAVRQRAPAARRSAGTDPADSRRRGRHGARPGGGVEPVRRDRAAWRADSRRGRPRRAQRAAPRSTQ